MQEVEFKVCNGVFFVCYWSIQKLFMGQSGPRLAHTYSVTLSGAQISNYCPVGTAGLGKYTVIAHPVYK